MFQEKMLTVYPLCRTSKALEPDDPLQMIDAKKTFKWVKSVWDCQSISKVTGHFIEVHLKITSYSQNTNVTLLVQLT
jgi:hypothetical protein